MNKFILTLDDYSPMPNTNNLDVVNRLIEKYKDLKITLFIPAAYARLGDTDPFYLSKHSKWIEDIKRLPDNYRVGLHGFYHRRVKKDFSWHKGAPSNNNEWELITYKQASLLLDKIEDEFDRAGLSYTKVFRPPAWHIGEEATKLLADRGYIIAGDNRYYKKHNKIIIKNNIKWVSYNWDLTGPCNASGDILAYGHASSWTNNYMNEERYNLICKFLDGRKFKFAFIEEF